MSKSAAPEPENSPAAWRRRVNDSTLQLVREAFGRPADPQGPRSVVFGTVDVKHDPDPLDEGGLEIDG